MPSFIIDENLPYHFNLWHNQNFIHVFDIPDISTDEDIWNYAKKHDLIIVTKDADFSIKVIFAIPPPKVIHLKIGNMRIAELHVFLNKVWPEILIQIDNHKLVNEYRDRIEAFD